MIPDSLQKTIDQILQSATPFVLRKAREFLSAEYRTSHSSKAVFSNEATRLAYLATRFPATFAAIQSVMKQIPNIECKTLLDLGAGPATATLACLEKFPHMQKIILVEKNAQAVTLGKELLQPYVAPTEWITRDLEQIETFPTADLVILSYSLGEIRNFEPILDRLWKANSSLIVIIEPGTPTGYQTILRARNSFVQLGAKILAPCPHKMQCPLKKDNWCHFSTRLQRTKLHRFLKEGSLGYEDEKFSYLVVSPKESLKEPSPRILRRPEKHSGHVRMTLCMPDGSEQIKIVTRKEKEIYQRARDSEWGDSFCGKNVHEPFTTCS